MKNNIPFNELLMGGNELNDISMAKLTSKGAFFVCVNNATKEFKRIISNLKNTNIIFAENNGAKGVLEGIKKVISAEPN